MEIHDKILLAGELLVDAAKIYNSGGTNADFAKSILLAGSVIGVVAPWLKELNIKSAQIQLSERVVKYKGFSNTSKEYNKEISRSMGFYRLTYNSLKHAGKGRELKASDDLLFNADLKEEAYFIIGHAIDDYNKLPLDTDRMNKLPFELLDLLQSSLWEI